MIKFLDLQKVNAAYADEIHAAAARVIDSGWYLLGRENAAFEEAYARYTGTGHAVGTANGLDALTLMLRAYIELGRLKPGDEVIVPANTYIATILSITENGLTPVLVEPRADTLQIDPALVGAAITPRTRAIMLVHLYGRCSLTPQIETLAQDNGLLLLEDNAQAHGCIYAPTGARTGSLGDAAAHSFYPGKNLGALGDGGAVTTDDPELAATVRTLANYGSSRKYVFDYQGRNSRLDEMQAAVLAAKLPHLDADNARRRAIAERYRAGITNPAVVIPAETEPGGNVYHIFPVLCEARDALQAHLAAAGVQTLIHYPIPPHRQKCYSEWAGLSLPVTEMIHARELSLPMSPVLTDAEADAVIAAVNSFK